MPRSDDLFSIGEVAKYQKISKQTLIFYDRIGLFRPAWVDPDNGYRYYSAKQLDELDAILIMKAIGFPLAEIRAHMQNYTIDSSLVALRRQLTVIDRQIRELGMLRSRVQHRCDQMEQARADRQAENAVTVGHTPAQYILCRPVASPRTLREISVATKQCFADSFAGQLPVFFQCGVIVPLENICAGRCTEASEAFLPIDPTDKADGLRLLPAGPCVSLCHVGDYLSIGRTYRKLLDYCDSHGLQIVSDSYEFCINDYITTRDESEYITKILFYIRPPEQPESPAP
ncbi:MAG TPA: MerR family transcriptional regulator [Candidatus Gemmiger faecigallinarum]|nr:MerR family transcriptional regulator [Candidatus Gemmiger faecigallinarum]